jgi:hypothetical protein
MFKLFIGMVIIFPSDGLKIEVIFHSYNFALSSFIADQIIYSQAVSYYETTLTQVRDVETIFDLEKISYLETSQQRCTVSYKKIRKPLMRH